MAKSKHTPQIDDLIDIMDDCPLTRAWLDAFEPLPQQPQPTDAWQHVTPSNCIH